MPKSRDFNGGVSAHGGASTCQNLIRCPLRNGFRWPGPADHGPLSNAGRLCGQTDNEECSGMQEDDQGMARKSDLRGTLTLAMPFRSGLPSASQRSPSKCSPESSFWQQSRAHHSKQVQRARNPFVSRSQVQILGHSKRAYPNCRALMCNRRVSHGPPDRRREPEAPPRFNYDRAT